MKITDIENGQNKIKFIVTSTKANFLFWPLDTSSIFIQKIIVGTKLTHHWKVMDQIDRIEKLETKSKYDVIRDQICSLPNSKKRIFI